MLIYTVPVFVIGLVFLWISKHRRKTKIIWSLLPIVFWYPCFLASMFITSTIGTTTAQKFDFIFEKDFKGKAVIIEKMPCGQEVILKNDREQLIIPKNGILLYQGVFETGYVNHKYYRKLNEVDVEELPRRSYSMYFESELNPPPKNDIGVWHEGTGTKNIYFPKPAIEYKPMSVIVSSSDSLNKYSEFQLNKEFESLTDSLVRVDKINCTQHRLSANSGYSNGK